MRDETLDRKGVWVALDSTQIGIDASTTVESRFERSHRSTIAQLYRRDSRGICYTDATLKRLGEARNTIAEQKRYLLNASEKFTVLLSHAINGTYADILFRDAMIDEGYHRRPRAVIQNELDEFAETLSAHGESGRLWMMTIMMTKMKGRSDIWNSLTRSLERTRRGRGRELLGMFNPLIVGDLFYLQAQPWAKLVTSCIETILESIQKAVHLLIKDILAERTAHGVLTKIINPELEKLGTAPRK